VTWVTTQPTRIKGIFR